MSADDQGGAGRREVAYRLFAAEFEDADFSYSESDEERAPNYVVTPTGARVNRLFVVGVLTEVENASEDVLRARVVDPTGAFVIYAGQYQPEAQAFFERADPPMFVAVTGKARTFQPDDSEITYTSIRPENVNEVDARTRDRWNVGTTRQTLARVSAMAEALGTDERDDDLRAALEARGVDDGLAAGIPLAIDHYGTTPAYLAAVRDVALGAAAVVAGEREEVEPFDVSPDAPGEADLSALQSLDVAPIAAGDADAVAPETLTGGDDETSAAAETDDSTAESGSDETPAASDSDDSTGAAASSSASESPDQTTPGGEATATTDESSTEASVETADSEESVESETASQSPDAEVETADADAEAATEPAATESDEDAEELDDFEPGEFDLDEEEREEIEEEFGTEFQSGTEVDSPGELDIDTPEPDGTADDGDVEADSTDETTDSTDETTDSTDETTDSTVETTAPSTEADETAASPDAAESDTADAESARTETDEAAVDPAEIDLEDAVMDAMSDHDEGDGASEDEIVDAVTARTGADAEAVREAIQDALMDGRCYEPDDGVYKPI